MLTQGTSKVKYRSYWALNITLRSLNANVLETKDFKEGWILCIIVFGKLIIRLKHLEWDGGFLIELEKLGRESWPVHGRRNELCCYRSRLNYLLDTV